MGLTTGIGIVAASSARGKSVQADVIPVVGRDECIVEEGENEGDHGEITANPKHLKIQAPLSLAAELEAVKMRIEMLEQKVIEPEEKQEKRRLTIEEKDKLLCRKTNNYRSRCFPTSMMMSSAATSSSRSHKRARVETMDVDNELELLSECAQVQRFFKEDFSIVRLETITDVAKNLELDDFYVPLYLLANSKAIASKELALIFRFFPPAGLTPKRDPLSGKIVALFQGERQVSEQLLKMFSLQDVILRRQPSSIVKLADEYVLLPRFQMDDERIYLDMSAAKRPIVKHCDDLAYWILKAIPTFSTWTFSDLKAVCVHAYSTAALSCSQNPRQQWSINLETLLKGDINTAVLGEAISNIAATFLSKAAPAHSFLTLLYSQSLKEATTEKILAEAAENVRSTVMSSFLASTGKFLLPYWPPAKSKSTLFRNENGDSFEMKRLSECLDTDMVITNSKIAHKGSLIAFSQSDNPQVYVVAAGAAAGDADRKQHQQVFMKTTGYSSSGYHQTMTKEMNLPLRSGLELKTVKKLLSRHDPTPIQAVNVGVSASSSAASIEEERELVSIDADLAWMF